MFKKGIMLSAFIPITASLQVLVTQQTEGVSSSQGHTEEPACVEEASISQEETAVGESQLLDNEETMNDSIVLVDTDHQKNDDEEEEDELISTPEDEELIVVSDKDISESKEQEQKQTSGDDIISVLMQDHNKVKHLYDTYRNEAILEDKIKLRNHIINEILEQDRCQQSTVYHYLKEPLFRKDRLDQYLASHRAIRDKLHDIRRANMAQDPEFDQKMEQVMAKTILFMDLEDLNMVDFLKTNLSEKELQAIGVEYRLQKSTGADKDLEQEQG